MREDRAALDAQRMTPQQAPDPTGYAAIPKMIDQQLRRIEVLPPNSQESKDAQVLLQMLRNAQGKMANNMTPQQAAPQAPAQPVAQPAPSAGTQAPDAQRPPERQSVAGSAQLPQQGALAAASLMGVPPEDQIKPWAMGEARFKEQMAEMDQNIDYWMKSYERAGGTPEAEAARAELKRYPDTAEGRARKINDEIQKAKLGRETALTEGVTADNADKKQAREFAQQDRAYQVAMRLPPGDMKQAALDKIAADRQKTQDEHAESVAKVGESGARSQAMGGGGAKGAATRIETATRSAAAAMSQHFMGAAKPGEVEAAIDEALGNATPADFPQIKAALLGQVTMMGGPQKDESEEASRARLPEMSRLTAHINGFTPGPAAGQGGAAPAGANKSREIVARARAKATADNAISELAAGPPQDEAALAQSLQMKLAPAVEELVASGVKPEDAANIAWGAIANSPAWKNKQFSFPIMSPAPLGSTGGYGPSLGSSQPPAAPLEDQSSKYRGVAAAAKKALVKIAIAKKATQIPVGG